MQEQKERMEPSEVVMDGGRTQPLLEVRNVCSEEGGIHVAEIPLAEPLLEAPKDIPVGGKGLTGPAFDPAGELERLPGLGEGEGLWYCVHGDTPRVYHCLHAEGSGTILWEAYFILRARSSGDRATAFEAVGRGFESLRARQVNQGFPRDRPLS